MSSEEEDWQEMSEDVSGHAVMSLEPHEDGRQCYYHMRLNMFTFYDNKQCLRTEHYTHTGKLFVR